MKKVIALAAVALMLLPVLATAAVNVSGVWKLTSQSPRGERTTDYTFTQEGEKLTVKFTSFRGDEMTATGSVKGAAIEWVQKMSTPRGDFEIVYKGTVEGDTMKGTAQMGDRGSMDWTAARAK